MLETKNLVCPLNIFAGYARPLPEEPTESKWVPKWRGTNDTTETRERGEQSNFTFSVFRFRRTAHFR